MKTTILTLMLALMLLMSSCAFVSERSYTDEMEAMDEGMFVPNRDFQVVGGDSGDISYTRREILRRTPASRLEKEKMFENFALEEELVQLESEQSGGMAEQYDKYREHLKTNSEKIYYLKLASKREREEYMASKGLFQGKHSNVSPQEEDAIGQHQIAQGMSKDAVLKSWGKPISVEVAGNPKYENERWVYRRNRKLEYVYFEGGLVEGFTGKN